MARKAFSHRCTDVVCIDEERVMFTKLFKLVFYFEKFQFYNLATHIFLSIKWSTKFVSMKFLIPCHSFIQSWKDRQGTFTISIQQFFVVSSFKVYSNTLKFIQQGNNKIVSLSITQEHGSKLSFKKKWVLLSTSTSHLNCYSKKQSLQLLS